MNKKYIRLTLGLLLIASLNAQAFALEQSNTSLNQVVSELKKLREEKIKLVKALGQAERNHNTALAISGLSVIAIIGTGLYTMFRGTVNVAEGLAGEIGTTSFIEQNASKILVLEGGAFAASSASGIYYQIEAKNYRKVIDALNSDIEDLTSKLILLTADEK